ncbi:MAG: Cytochrome c [Chthoniobacteraceae bacterium]|nr:Cytochrome c [Chthoniobacteraceae bacterium]
MRPRYFLPAACLCLNAALAAPEAPKAVPAGMTVQLSAIEPSIRTPTALAIDARGRVWVLENNTHFRPKNYTGPAADRIVVLEDFGPDGLAKKLTTFADDFHDGMGLCILSNGDVILSTRMETWRLRDTDHDGHCDQRTRLLQLSTADTYPHNGLSSVTVDSAGLLYIGLGENHGMPWTLTGVDGATVKGSDEGGIFRCDADGNHLERWALGLWNPFGLAFDAQGRLFALDNDPGAGSNCRLLHIVKGGDYGFRYRYGRTTQHPFLAWTGELPGTLPPVCLSGEAPVGLLARGGELLGCTWNDHGVQRFPLSPHGASWVSTPTWLVNGGPDFRPTGIAAASDGTLYVGDWVDGAYEVHGKGRLWRISAPAQPAAPVSALRPAESELAGLLNGKITGPAALQYLKNADPFLIHGGIEALVHGDNLALLQEHIADPDPKIRLGVLIAMRRRGAPEGIAAIPAWLKDSSPQVKRSALQWIGEEQLKDLRPTLESALDEPLSRTVFEAYVAALQLIKTGKPDPSAATQEMVNVALDPARSPAVRSMALRLIPNGTAALSMPLLAGIMKNDGPSVLSEAVTRILASRSDEPAQAELRRIAASTQAAITVKLEALAGLVHSVGNPETRAVLNAALQSGQSPLIREALRSLRGRLEASEVEFVLKQIAADPGAAEELGEQLLFAARATPLAGLADSVTAKLPAHIPAAPETDAAFLGKGDPAAGRRLIFHPSGPLCSACHSVEGRGGAVGPDLSDMSKLTPTQLLESIREPSKEIAPAFTTFHLTLRDGREAYGIDLFQDDKSAVTLRDATGATAKYKNSDIVTREPLPVSMMPPGLGALMTTQELRDVIAFLHESRQ